MFNWLKNVVAAVIADSVYFLCFPFRGDSFRREVTHLGETRSVVPESINLMALTATATLCTRRFITRSLSMINPAVVYIYPVKYNITERHN